MITAGLDFAGGGRLALFEDDRLAVMVPLTGNDVGDAVRRALADQHVAIGDVGQWASDTTAGRATGIGSLDLNGRATPCTFYGHLAGHVAAAYSTSPVAGRGVPVVVLVWDDACPPRLYHVDPAGRVTDGPLLAGLPGRAFALAGRYLGAAGDVAPVGDAAAACQVADLAAQGSAHPELVEAMRALVQRHAVTSAAALDPFLGDLRSGLDDRWATADVAAALQTALGDLLVERLAAALPEEAPVSLCFTGDCARNVAWNSALADHPAVKELWIPPFPDASGAAFGAAALHLGATGGLRRLDWGMRRGPELARHPHLPTGWSAQPCRPEELARLLLRSGKPVAVLAGRAKLGSHALGSRSVLAPATDPATRALLNRIAGRDQSRRLVPICLTTRAADVFEPGTPDPYHQYAHRLRPEWTEQLPALDRGSGPMQTVDREDDPFLATVIREFHKWGGAPVLCTAPVDPGTADHLADAASAMRWGGVEFVWSDYVLHRRLPTGA